MLLRRMVTVGDPPVQVNIEPAGTKVGILHGSRLAVHEPLAI